MDAKWKEPLLTPTGSKLKQRRFDLVAPWGPNSVLLLVDEWDNLMNLWAKA